MRGSEHILDEKSRKQGVEHALAEQINHGICVSNLAYRLSKELGYPEEFCMEMANAGMVHDIGKMKLDSYIYGDNTVLSVEKLRYIRMHSKLGYDLLKDKGYSDLVLVSILYHHENFDGSGYPENLQGEDIPEGARILRVCDVYAALTSDRTYRKAFDKQTAVELMIEEVKNFDMKIFLAFMGIMNDNV